ncbi:SURF1 family cytochrome oxidase biogenesis protein [Microbacterium sp. NPDC055357]
MKNAPAAVRWSTYVLVAAVFAIACAFLSDWQFTRNGDRSAQLALVEQNYDAAPVAFAELIPDGETLDAGDEWHPVVLTGEYLADEQLLVRNRPHGGTAAYEVLVPFRLDDGRVLVVDRGWVPPGADQPEPDAVPAPPAGEATVIVRLRPGEPLPASGRTADAGQVPTINLPFVAERVAPDIGDALVQSAYGIIVSEDPAVEAMPGSLPSPSEDPGPYLSYAIQWILFAVMGFIFIGYMIRTEIIARREDAEDDEHSPPRPPRPAASARRRDRDADAEDALLDAVR